MPAKSTPELVNPLRPCALTGACCAIEGIRGAVALINGSTGCKFYVSSLVDFQDPDGDRPPRADRSILRILGQPRVPCTDTTNEDVIFGAEAKLVEALEAIERERSPQLVAVANSCAMTVIGDDLKGILRSAGTTCQTVTIDSGGFIGDAARGFSEAGVGLVREVMQPGEVIPGTVNLLGLSIGQFNWRNDVAELKRLLGAVGVGVNAVLTAGATLDEVAAAPRAALNVVVHDEYGTAIAQEMRERFGTPFVGGDTFAPYGLANTTAWIGRIGAALNVDAPAARALEDEAQQVIVPALTRLERVWPWRGASVAIFADTTAALSLAAFLDEYLGLAPALVGLKATGPHRDALVRGLAEWAAAPVRVLDALGLPETRAALTEADPTLVFGSTYEKAILRDGLGARTPFVDFAFPVWDHVVLTDRSYMGYRGAVALVEEVINSRVAIYD